jgi:hypothetical protein
MALALVMLSGTVVSTSKLLPATQEDYTAVQGASNVIEAMHGADVDEVFALFNDFADDDPNGPGTAPGAHFEVEGLQPLDDDADGFVGHVVLPELRGALREDVQDPRLGMPRDLSGDAEVDVEDHAGDWILLPVLIRVEWRGQNGPRSLETSTMIGRWE